MTDFDPDQRIHHDQTNELPFRPRLLVFFSALSLVTLAAGGLLTSLGLGPWYRDLQIPWFQPPAWAFTPAWLIIFVLLAISTWRISRHGSIAALALSLYGFQLVANALWSFFFFPLERPDLALFDILVLDALVIGMTVLYGRIDRTSGLLLLPYVVWLALATAINFWIVRYN
ncbi:MAG: TspO protein [Phycisphaerae bacterium]|nr:TspO protein [Phycisphaerae bacterium]